jgi:hypothetical protein
MDAMSDESVPTVRDRLTAAGISAERIDEHHVESRVLLDGEPVTDLDTPAAKPARVVIGPA